MKIITILVLAGFLLVSCTNQQKNDSTSLPNLSSSQSLSASASLPPVDSSVPQASEASVERFPVLSYAEKWDYFTLTPYRVEYPDVSGLVPVASFVPEDVRIKTIEIDGSYWNGQNLGNGLSIVVYDSVDWQNLSSLEKGLFAHEILKSVERTMAGYDNLYWSDTGYLEDGTMIFMFDSRIAGDGHHIILWDGTGTEESYENKNREVVNRQEMEKYMVDSVASHP